MIDEIIGIERYISGIIDEAFYKIFLRSEENWCSICEINFDYSCNDDIDILPLIRVGVEFYHKRFDGDVHHIEVSINFKESRDYNVGHVESAFERECDDE